MLCRRLSASAAGHVLAATLLAAATPGVAVAAPKRAPKTGLTKLVLSPASVETGGTVRVSMTIANKTRSKLGKLAITITAGGKTATKHDTVVGVARASALAARKSTTASLTASLPSVLAPGTYVVRACVTGPVAARSCAAATKRLTVTARHSTPPPSHASAPVRPAGASAAAPGSAGSSAAPPAPAPTPPSSAVAPPAGAAPVLTAPTTPAVVPSNPAGAAPATPGTRSASFADANDFLYTGPGAVQQGVSAGAISPQRISVLRGRVLTTDGSPAPGVTVTILGATELGSTHTQSDGRFDMAVNGGGSLTVTFTGANLLAVQRAVVVPWGEFTQVPDVVMLSPDPKVTDVTPGAATTQVATGTTMNDGRGTRTNTLVFDPGTSASAVMPDGSSTPLTDLHVHATEYTVGADGPARMPGSLPKDSAYTYAVALTVDEAQAAGATGVTFSKPVVDYVDDFVGFPVGSPVPVGRYDPATGRWVAAPSGRIIAVLGVGSDGAASLDVDGDAVADSGSKLSDLGIDPAELRTIGARYSAPAHLMRVQLTHFSDYDFNWEAPDTRPPNLPDPEHNPDPPPECENAGSIVGCENQSLGEVLPIAGTPYRLEYDSTAQPGSVATQSISVSVTGAAVSSNLESIDVTIDVAGNHHVEHFPNPTPNQTYNYRWNGRDAYGRIVSTATTATVTVTDNLSVPYSYTASWGSTDPGGSSWNGTPPQVIAPDSASWQVSLGSGRPGGRPSGATPIDNWGLSVSAAYDPVSHQLATGGGTLSRADDANKAFSVIAGTGEAAYDPGTGLPVPTDDGGAATDANFTFARGVAAGPNGVTYIGDCVNNEVRAVGADGLIRRFAGNGGGADPSQLASDEGKPALQVSIGCPLSVAVGSDGSVYTDDETLDVVWQIRPDGTIHRVAGNGTAADKDTPVNDGAAAAGQPIDPNVVTVDPDGNVYIGEASEGDVLRVDPQGVLHRFAGVRWDSTSACAPLDDGQPAKGVKLCGVTGLGALPNGAILISDPGHGRVRRVGTTGTISTVAGNGDLNSDDGDGGPAIDASVALPGAIAVASDGSFAFADLFTTVREVSTDATITRLAGDPSDTSSGPVNAAGYTAQPAGSRLLLSPNSGLSWAPDGSLLISAGTQHGGLGSAVLRLRTTIPRTGSGEIDVPSLGGQVIYVFDQTGRHLRTLNALTGTTRTSLSYDNAGRLTQVADQDGSITSIQRDAAGTPTAVVAPGGQRTVLTTNAAGELASVTDPIQRATTLTYAAGSLLTGLKDGAGGQHAMTYDGDGHLTSDAEPGSGTRHLARTDLGGGAFTVADTDAGGHVTAFTVDRTAAGRPREQITDPAGGVTSSTTALDGSTVLERPDGTTLTTKLGPDPRFGMQAPIVTSAAENLDSGSGERHVAARSVVLGSSLFDLSKQTDTSTACVTLDGDCTGSDAHPSDVMAYDEATHTITTTSPAGRTVVTTLDAQDHVIKVHTNVGADATLTYDGAGRMLTAKQGNQTMTYGYDARGYPASATDSLGHTTTYAYDAAGELTAVTRASGRVLHFAYDGNGETTSVTLPSGAVQSLHRTPTELIDMYTPSAGAAAHASFNASGQATALTLASGASVALTTDAAGRRDVTSMTGAGTIGYTYAAGQLLPETIDRTAGDGVAAHAQQSDFSYRGPLVKQEQESGASAGTFDYTYDDRDRLSHVSLSGASAGADAWDVKHDDDGEPTGVSLTTQSHDITLTPNGPNGRATKVVNGPQIITYTYDPQGRLATQHDDVNGAAVYNAALARDARGRVTTSVETTAQGQTTMTYTYDVDGRLTAASRNGTPVEADTYNADGSRTAGGAPGSPVAAAYDSAGRMTQLGGASVTVNDDGHESARASDAFAADAAGELKSATVSGATTSYLSDGQGRRIARDPNSATKAETYLYGDQGDVNQVTASTDAAGKRTTYWYDPAGRLIALDRDSGSGANTWNYVATDWRGSPRVVTDAAGTVLDAVAYSAWGVATATVPSYRLPIGFAGGLTDPDTGLVHFGARDYDPVAGRWMARDPLVYEGAVIGAYVYGSDDPVNQMDPSGLADTSNAGGGHWYDGAVSYGQAAVDWAVDKFKSDHGVDKVEKLQENLDQALDLKDQLNQIDKSGYEDTHKGAKQGAAILGYCLQKWNDLASHLPFNPVPGKETKGLLDSGIKNIESVQGDQSPGNTYDDVIQRKIRDGN